MTRTTPLPPLAVSGGLHALLALTTVLVIYRNSPVSEIVPLEVIEAPRASVSDAKINYLPVAKPAPQKMTERREVFGLSRKSVTADASDASAPEIKAGNTVAKAQDDQKLRDDDPDALPIPADEFLVSKMPVLLSDFRVPYPPEARKKGLQGAVIFDLLIDAKGAVRQANLIDGPGGGLNEAAAQAITRLQFKPAIVDDKPVAVRIRYAYRFVLER